MYQYEHTNGSTIDVPNIVVDAAGGPDEYFASPYVVSWWLDGGQKTFPNMAVPPTPPPSGREDSDILTDLVEHATIDLMKFVVERIEEDKMTRAEILILTQRLLVVMIQTCARPQDYGLVLGMMVTTASHDLDMASSLRRMLDRIIKGGSNEKT